MMIRNETINRLHQVFLPGIKAAAGKSWLALFIAAAIFSTTVVSLANSTGRHDHDKAASKSDDDDAGVTNFGKVTDFYYRGAQPKDDEYGKLAALGIKTVIDLRDDPKDYAKSMAEQAGMKYVNMPMSDKRYPSSDVAGKFLSVINEKANWPVYVHCAGGRHRTGAMTAVFRMSVQGWDIERAYEEMKDYDFYTRWGHKAMKKFVFDYYQGLLQSRNESQKSQITVPADLSNK